MEEAKLKSYLQCPICTFLPHSHNHNAKIWGCQNGHRICEQCYDKLDSYPKRCPQGRCKYNSPPCRLTCLEDMISQGKLKIDCHNAEHGCQVVLYMEELIEHELECKFRMVPCPEADCQKMVILSQLEVHCSENDEHSNSDSFDKPDILRENEESITRMNFSSEISDAYYVNGFWIVEGFRFWSIIMKENNYWNSWVTIEGGPRVAAQWKYSVSVKNKKTGVSYEMTGPVNSVDWTAKQVLDSGCYLSLNSAAIKGLKKVNRSNMEDAAEGRLWKLRFVYTIKQITP
eukprot:GFUD01016841.1.p1 GENE.GFUD01016841.1~~GFUD01016841.1.p1  ORF type:complete len:287 (-),score=47.56 GFUD01016841.1:31-891(-)